MRDRTCLFNCWATSHSYYPIKAVLNILPNTSPHILLDSVAEQYPIVDACAITRAALNLPLLSNNASVVAHRYQISDYLGCGQFSGNEYKLALAAWLDNGWELELSMYAIVVVNIFSDPYCCPYMMDL